MDEHHHLAFRASLHPPIQTDLRSALTNQRSVLPGDGFCERRVGLLPEFPSPTANQSSGWEGPASWQSATRHTTVRKRGAKTRKHFELVIEPAASWTTDRRLFAARAHWTRLLRRYSASPGTSRSARRSSTICTLEARGTTNRVAVSAKELALFELTVRTAVRAQVRKDLVHFGIGPCKRSQLE